MDTYDTADIEYPILEMIGFLVQVNLQSLFRNSKTQFGKNDKGKQSF